MPRHVSSVPGLVGPSAPSLLTVGSIGTSAHGHPVEGVEFESKKNHLSVACAERCRNTNRSDAILVLFTRFGLQPANLNMIKTYIGFSMTH